jgi:prepilin-type N-terminal cleavage/methylation domain-containing protein
VQNRNGFTLIELVIVVLIVGILASVAIPLMRGRVDLAKWTEGKTGLGAIASALRAYAAEKRTDGTYGAALPTLQMLGFSAEDLQGAYFSITDYQVTASSFTPGNDPELTYTLTATAPAGISNPAVVMLDEAGNWTP